MTAGMAGSAFTGAYNSFSGVDIKAVFGSEVIGELQGVSYSITREKAPVYTMGSADPRSFSRGKRGIAGTLIFVIFDRHALLGVMGAMRKSPLDASRLFWADKTEILPVGANEQNIPTTSETSTAGAIERLGSGGTVGDTVQGVAELTSELISTNLFDDQQQTAPWYADQIPPFDISLAAANEYGALAVMRIYGAEILNEGYGCSVDDAQSSQQMTYVARMVLGWSAKSH
jgi:hypothetical protein